LSELLDGRRKRILPLKIASVTLHGCFPEHAGSDHRAFASTEGNHPDGRDLDAKFRSQLFEAIAEDQISRTGGDLGHRP